MSSTRLNLDKPRYDQSTFEGRAKHFFATTNPLNVLASDEELARAKHIVDSYREGTEDKNLTEEEIWKAKELYDSAYHCQTGEKLFILGRMSFQVPGNMLITGCMMTFYKTTPAVIFWQTANQSFNSLVNYTNRNASVGVSTQQLGMAYVGATSASVLTALAFNKAIASRPALAAGIVGRLVPMVAVAAANCVNIPLMRQQVRNRIMAFVNLIFLPQEIKNGITIELEDGTPVGQSSNAAVAAVSQVIPSRVGMAAPAMFIPPVIMSRLEKTATFIKNPWMKAPATVRDEFSYSELYWMILLSFSLLLIQVLLTGLCLTFSTPLCCALFPQKATIHLKDLEPHLQKVSYYFARS